MEKEWYVVNTYSGHENKVKEKLEMRASSMGLEDYILRIVVPEETETIVTDGKTKEKINKLFPGYIIVEMIMTDEAWFIVRNTPGVTGFIGSSGKGAKPFPLTPPEVDKILHSMNLSRLDTVSIGDSVKVLSEPFAGREGKVLTLNMNENNTIEDSTLEVAIDLFGQETIIELTLKDVSKI